MTRGKPLVAFWMKKSVTPKMVILSVDCFITVEPGNMSQLIRAHNRDSWQFEPVWCGTRLTSCRHGRGRYDANAQNNIQTLDIKLAFFQMLLWDELTASRHFALGWREPKSWWCETMRMKSRSITCGKKSILSLIVPQSLQAFLEFFFISFDWWLYTCRFYVQWKGSYGPLPSHLDCQLVLMAQNNCLGVSPRQLLSDKTCLKGLWYDVPLKPKMSDMKKCMKCRAHTWKHGPKACCTFSTWQAHTSPQHRTSLSHPSLRDCCGPKEKAWEWKKRRVHLGPTLSKGGETQRRDWKT